MTLKALYTLDHTDNTAILQCVGDDELIRVQRARFELLVGVLNSPPTTLAALGLPETGNRNELVVIDAAEIGVDHFHRLIGCAGQKADKIKTLSMPAIETPTEPANGPTCATCACLVADHSHPGTDGLPMNRQRGWICTAFAHDNPPRLLSGWSPRGCCEMHTPC